MKERVNIPCCCASRSRTEVRAYLTLEFEWIFGVPREDGKQ
jgi:hypothetical protein